MQCKHCGLVMGDNAKFCTQCGRSVLEIKTNIINNETTEKMKKESLFQKFSNLSTMAKILVIMLVIFVIMFVVAFTVYNSNRNPIISSDNVSSSRKNNIDKIALNCAYTRISSIAEKTGNVLKKSEIIEKDNYGRYLAHFQIDLLVSGSYKTGNYYIIVWDVKENGEFMCSPMNELNVSFYNGIKTDTIEYAKELYNWNEPISD